MLWIVPNFIESVDDNVLTNEEHRLCDSDLESDKEDDADDPDLGAEAYGPDSDDDMDEM